MGIGKEKHKYRPRLIPEESILLYFCIEMPAIYVATLQVVR